MSLSGAAIGVLLATGVLLAVVGWIGTADEPKRDRAVSIEANRTLVLRVAMAFGAFIVVWFLTGWIAAGLSVAAIGLMIPLFFDARRQRDAAIARAEALAMWAEMLRDTIATHAGLQQAILLTSTVAPEEIRAAVRALALRSAQMPLHESLRQFAADVADPVGDKIVAALAIADTHQARNLPELLGEIARNTREQASSRSRVETGRARTYASARSMVIITALLVVMMTVISPEFMKPYDSAAGQIALGIVGALFVGAVWALIQLGRPVPEPRVLSGVAKVVSR